jgi:hypothetical protein
MIEKEQDMMKPRQTPLNKAHKQKGKRRNKERGPESKPEEKKPRWVTIVQKNKLCSKITHEEV